MPQLKMGYLVRLLECHQALLRARAQGPAGRLGRVGALLVKVVDARHELPEVPAHVAERRRRDDLRGDRLFQQGLLLGQARHALLHDAHLLEELRRPARAAAVLRIPRRNGRRLALAPRPRRRPAGARGGPRFDEVGRGRCGPLA